MKINQVKNLVDIKLIKFIVVGVVNTIVGMAIMFGLYNLFHFSYWVASGCNYFFTSILSYFLNRKFTFSDKSPISESGIRFFINIVLCYFLAYGLAKPGVAFILSDFSVTLKDNISMALGMCLFVGFNYLGQRLFVFKNQACIDQGRQQ